MSNTELPFTPLLIDGQFRPASNGASFEVRNPFSQKVVGRAASATSQDVKDAIESAGRAFQTWEKTPLGQRRDIFLKAADLLDTEKYKAKINAAAKEETASVDYMSIFNIYAASPQIRDVAGMISHLKGETFPSDVPGGYVVAQRRAMGVVLAISPWNAPIYLAIRAVAIPIICGNTVVLKSSEVTPRTQAIVAELFQEAGLPNGVLNYISVDRSDAPALTAEAIAHPLVRKINFTGSDRVGRIIAGEAAKHLKPCVFELGGKSPAVVLNDADIENAARAIVSSATWHSGQICMSTERVIAQSEAAKKLIPAIQKLMNSLKAGDPHSDPNHHLSALFTEASAENVVNMIKEAKEQGAEVLVGDVKREGAVIQPHVIGGVKTSMRIWQRETFGPVVVVTAADTIDEVVELANQTDYSLAASLWTKDLNLALDVGSRIRAGSTNINGPTIHIESMRGLTGLGGATGYGHFDVENFTDVRMLIIHPSGPRPWINASAPL
ncbi:aldehyde dehydrogenase [Panus rudis PR-1116 ss-1]|nr:aldehyde dehydrogenase [Panus rudis PR-1116 ss-1]